MSPDDARHGTMRGYRVHIEDAETACDPCALAWYRYGKRATYLRITGQSLRVSSTGTHRRVRALMTMGHGLPAIAAALGIATGNLSYKLQQPYVNRHTHDAVADLYDDWTEKPEPEGWVAQRTRNIAAKRGWAPPAAWLDIDDPTETPDPGYRTPHWRHPDDYDFAVVERLLAGDFALAAMTSRAEKEAVCAAWAARGDSLNELERLTGWEPRRYVRSGREKEAS